MEKKYKLISLSLLCLWGANAGELCTSAHGLFLKAQTQGVPDSSSSKNQSYGSNKKPWKSGASGSSSSKNQSNGSKKLSPTEAKTMEFGNLMESFLKEYEQTKEKALETISDPTEKTYVKKMCSGLERKIRENIVSKEGRKKLAEVILPVLIQVAKNDQDQETKEIQDELKKTKNELAQVSVRIQELAQAMAHPEEADRVPILFQELNQCLIFSDGLKKKIKTFEAKLKEMGEPVAPPPEEELFEEEVPPPMVPVPPLMVPVPPPGAAVPPPVDPRDTLLDVLVAAEEKPSKTMKPKKETATRGGKRERRPVDRLGF
ncbi:MAG: hypothetical protein LBG09_00005 [Puniceicoccales bacterium]|jgi:hypothetical protein|nr:hypothetical protein [Puniceicoccales bacterium]